jgi:hypothetical protein
MPNTQRPLSWISMLLGLILLAPFVWAISEDYLHGRDNSVGAMFVPLIQIGLGVFALIGAALFSWGVSRLRPRLRDIVLAGLSISIFSAGGISFLWWSHANIANVVSSAESVAGDKPYCIDVPSGNTYKQAASLSDFSGANMRGAHEGGVYGGPHAILALGSDVQPDTYHWSYARKSFIKDVQLSLGIVHCFPRAHFVTTMSTDQRHSRQIDEFRFAGMHFSIPSIYRSRIPYDNLPSLAFYATAPKFESVPADGQPGGHWSGITVYFEDNDRVESLARLLLTNNSGEEYGLKKASGAYTYQYFNISSDNKFITLINCPDSAAINEEYCVHMFRNGGWTYNFYHKPEDLVNWKIMEEKLVKLTRSFVKSSVTELK